MLSSDGAGMSAEGGRRHYLDVLGAHRPSVKR